MQYSITTYQDTLHPENATIGKAFLYTGPEESVYYSHFNAEETPMLKAKHRKKYGLDEKDYPEAERVISFINRIIYKDLLAKKSESEEKIVADFKVQKATTNYAGRDYVA